MTRRIAIAILLTVWAILIVSGVLTYVVTRSLLLNNLDETLMTRALSLPEVERPSAVPRVADADERDRFVIRNAQGQTVARPALSRPGDAPPPQLASAEFSRLADGSRIRTITVKAYARRAAPADPLVPVNIVYSGRADHFDDLLRRLLLTLGIVGVAGGALTAAIAGSVARTALKPMINTAREIGGINENSLDKRIGIDQLPPELIPVGTTLNAMLDRLDTAFSQRRQFLADASHELRTPVAAIMTTLEVALHRTRDVEEYNRILNSCLGDAQFLKQLVEALLEQVRSERFSARDDSEPIDLSALLRQCADVTESLAQQRKITVERRIDPGLVLITNEDRVRSIVINLLSNAVEYNKAGGSIELAATLAPVSDDASSNGHKGTGVASRVRIDIRDSGVGIPPDELPHIFEPFYRADKARSQSASHLGLGLFLVKTHVDALGGVCRVESKPGMGTSFHIEIPSAPVTSEATLCR